MALREKYDIEVLEAPAGVDADHAIMAYCRAHSKNIAGQKPFS